MHGYLRLIVLKSSPISFIEDSVVRLFLKFENNFSGKLQETVDSDLTELFEHRIERIMTRTKRAIIHDESTNNETNYVAMFASFIRAVA